ncbi:methylated-DNA--protein-cysteine methyltransferase AdaB [Listeria fleischmannii 1991]|uniref:methylated-DNA--[protein]-cysteine S-methyltransferase n=2 Tax=Listeria fleischmannii TaxID=1069827 RepID=A0A2X3HDD2_9LIST|nr:methylated-DNA--[protein]-cysteine S-methyltransferase [Listeria fleischmannii]EMG27541.1 AdaB [Listeria fleischmannii subsp. fleischmannii LU2006-1]KMT59205.1 methylated-DNA--protein-cysteine methyltransferase AdaB [Listeria fleischmannii 1991]SQC70567.1 Methylated-DNA--protein-cysteine methyltransferase, inducible [Listeria fleischmannii subsp. fleischmannii]
MIYDLVEEVGLYVAKTSRGVCYIGNNFDDLAAFSKKKFGGEEFRRSAEFERESADLKAYFNGKKVAFDWSFDLATSDFTARVFQVLRTIPYGQTATYSEIAEKMGNKKAVRAVGRAIGSNPVLIAIPCHRVIGKSGKLTGYRDGLALKEKLLHIENA